METQKQRCVVALRIIEISYGLRTLLRAFNHSLIADLSINVHIIYFGTKVGLVPVLRKRRIKVFCFKYLICSCLCNDQKIENRPVKKSGRDES